MRVAARVLYRPAESRAVMDFLASSAAEPTALLVEGEAGIGKTTVWLSAVEEARRRGIVVLWARPSAAEVTLAHASIADLLRGVPASRLADLPPPQRLAVGRVLQLEVAEGAETDPQAIGAALLSVVEGFAAEGPVLLAVDDAQWLDASSTAVLGFVVRRLSGPVGVLVAVRTGPDGDDGALPWLHLPRPESVARVTVHPLGLGALHAVLTERLGRSFSRPVMTRIQTLSGGNPFYALELGRTVDGPADLLPPSATRSDLVRERFDGVGNELRDLLLAVASLADATVELVQAVCHLDNEELLVLLEDAEARGLVIVEGHHVRFAHPLLAAAVRRHAGPAGRRQMHRRLAAVVQEPEQRARHLALAAVREDRQTLEALDSAAVLARARGAPAAAAELLELAISLGGATPERRLRAAVHQFDAGNTDLARRALEELVGALPPGRTRASAMTALGLVRLHDDSFVMAAAVLEQAVAEVGNDLRPRAEALLRLAYSELNIGRLDAAHAHFVDATEAAALLGDQSLMRQADGFGVMLGFVRGDGLDQHAIDRAHSPITGWSHVPLEFRPSVQAALLEGWTGRLDAAAEGIRTVRRECTERGEENDLVYLDFHATLFELWRGRLADASAMADAAWERAMLLDRDVPLAVAGLLRGHVAAHAGRLDEARAQARASLAVCQRCGWPTMAMWPMTTLGLVEVSAGNYQAAVTALEPLLSGSAVFAASEIISSPFVPDAVEALVQLGRLDDAEPLVEAFESNGRRLDRAWARAIGARGRALLRAARGDVDAATTAATEAMAQHDRIPMPFERARTQLLLGQLLRRRRKKESATAALREALLVFDQLGTVLWAERAHAELVRVADGTNAGDELTPTERRVAELAAAGKTNREVASALFISPKTVEANLARVYRKLDIRSRAELGRLMGPIGS